MVNLNFGFTFQFLRDKSADKLVKEHEAELAKLRAEKEKKDDKETPV
jgi:hypothetical protein